MEHSALSVVALSLGLLIVVCILMGCWIRLCCPFWLSERMGFSGERIYQAEGDFSKSPSLFSCNLSRNPQHSPHMNIPIVIVSDENGKRVMGGKDVTCVYEKQDLEEIL